MQKNSSSSIIINLFFNFIKLLHSLLNLNPLSSKKYYVVASSSSAHMMQHIGSRHSFNVVGVLIHVLVSLLVLIITIDFPSIPAQPLICFERCDVENDDENK
jgi:uncharacterized membrane protein